MTPLRRYSKEPLDIFKLMGDTVGCSDVDCGRTQELKKNKEL